MFHHLCAPIRNKWKPLLVDTGIERVLLSRNFQCGSDFMVIHKREGKYFALKLNSFFISFSLILHFSVAHIPAFWDTQYMSHLFSNFSQSWRSRMLSIQSPHNPSIWACNSMLLSQFWKPSIHFTCNSLLLGISVFAWSFYIAHLSITLISNSVNVLHLHGRLWKDKLSLYNLSQLIRIRRWPILKKLR